MKSISVFILIVLVCLWNIVNVSQGQTCTYKGQCEKTIRLAGPCGAFFLRPGSCTVQHVVIPVSCLLEEPCSQSFDPWSACTASCGGGTRTRSGTCTGSQCSDLITDTEACNTDICPTVPNVDGNWGEWSNWATTGSCSRSCCTGSQERVRTRTCDAPMPSGNGTTCPGVSSETDTSPCNTQVCPVSCSNLEAGTFLDSPCGYCTSNFLRCELDRENATVFTCGAGTVWSQSENACVFPFQCSK